MNRLTTTARRVIVLPLTAVAMTASVLVAAPTGEAQAASRFAEQEFVQSVRWSMPATAGNYTDRKLLNAGYYSCQRNRARGLGWQVGKARARVQAAVAADVNRNHFSGRRLTLAKKITNIADSPAGGFGLGLC